MTRDPRGRQVEERSPLLVRLFGVIGMALFGSVISLALIFGFFAAIIGTLLVLTSPSAWAPLLGGG